MATEWHREDLRATWQKTMVLLQRMVLLRPNRLRAEDDASKKSLLGDLSAEMRSFDAKIKSKERLCADMPPVSSDTWEAP